MKKLRGRYLALALSIIAVLTLAAAAFVFRNQLREQWYLLMLDSSEPELRDLAIRKLGEMRSARALPHLRKILLNPEKGQRADSPCAKALARIGQPAVPVAEEALASSDQKVRLSGQFLLFGILGQCAQAEKVPILLRQLDSPDQFLQSMAGFLLRGHLEKTGTELSPLEMEKLDRISPKGSPAPNPFQFIPPVPTPWKN